MDGGRQERATIRLEPWGAQDLALLAQCVGDPAMMAHLGGPESAEKIAERQARYEQPGSMQFKIVDRASGEGAGWVGFWDAARRGEDVYEIGWSVTTPFQRRGIAVAAASEALDVARARARRRFVHAFPAVANVPSNAICRRLGFALQGACDIEYPPGNRMRSNDWRLDLRAGG